MKAKGVSADLLFLLSHREKELAGAEANCLYAPKKATSWAQLRVAAIAPGQHHTIAVTDDNKVGQKEVKQGATFCCLAQLS